MSPERENSSEPLLTPQLGCLSVSSHGDSILETPSVLCSTFWLAGCFAAEQHVMHTFSYIPRSCLSEEQGKNISTALSIDAAWKLAGFYHGNEPAHTNWGWFSILFPLWSVNRGVLERWMLIFLKQQLYNLNLGSELAAEPSSKEKLFGGPCLGALQTGICL